MEPSLPDPPLTKLKSHGESLGSIPQYLTSASMANNFETPSESFGSIPQYLTSAILQQN